MQRRNRYGRFTENLGVGRNYVGRLGSTEKLDVKGKGEKVMILLPLWVYFIIGCIAGLIITNGLCGFFMDNPAKDDLERVLFRIGIGVFIFFSPHIITSISIS